jgi:hypothetical protein
VSTSLRAATSARWWKGHDAKPATEMEGILWVTGREPGFVDRQIQCPHRRPWHRRGTRGFCTFWPSAKCTGCAAVQLCCAAVQDCTPFPLGGVVSVFRIDSVLRVVGGRSHFGSRFGACRQ